MEEKYRLAMEMTGFKKLPPDLKARLDRVSEMVEETGGFLVSRQVIANIIFNWELQV